MTSKDNQTLHFSFSPVQAFVSQARRTRDLWAGSYLLAWLSGQAISSILKDNANDKETILIPDVENDLLVAAINNAPEFFAQRSEKEKLLVKSLGTLPNRFTAIIPKDTPPKNYADVIQAKWIELANKVRQTIDPNHELIAPNFWKRQIDNHWEFNWVIGEDCGLDRRKNFRLPKYTEERGEKCTVCGERQELSECKKSTFKPNREASKKWWDELKEQAKHQIGTTDLDLRDNERLCAVCLTKRLFPLFAEATIGWAVDPYYPSTAYLAAIDWLETVLDAAVDIKRSEAAKEEITKAANELAATAQKIGIYNSEYNTKINCLTEKIKLTDISKAFIQLDGDVFYVAAIEADQLVKRNDNKTLSTPEKQKLSKALAALQKAVGSSATPFYAILLMDGDGMGALLSGQNDKNRKDISKALANFTHNVPEIVHLHNGRLIYAGGDDVFALLPVSKAIECAATCRKAYQTAFAKLPQDTKKKATISAAVQFAHQNIALSVVIKDAHHLLDDIAKNSTGRDALACRVWKPGGIALTWSQPWVVTDEAGQIEIEFAELLEKVMKDFHPKSQTERFSSKFFYKLRDLFEWIERDDSLTHEAIQDLLIAEYLANREHNWQDKNQGSKQEQAEERIGRLLQLCQEQKRVSQDGQIRYEQQAYNADAALLVRFLVQKEV